LRYSAAIYRRRLPRGGAAAGNSIARRFNGGSTFNHQIPPFLIRNF
jgi:hypothetical protein